MEENVNGREGLSAIIRRRRTLKVLGDIAEPRQIDPGVARDGQKTIKGALADAGWAPFHYDRGVGGLAEPWRAHLLWHPKCRWLAEQFTEWFPDAGPTNKLPRMLAGCGALALITWLPEFRGEENSSPKQQAIDDEHLAATAAMVQNFLLLLTAAGMGTYWSSGGQLGSGLCFEKLGIPSGERLLAAVFIEYPEQCEEPMERVPGKLRESRSTDWIREI